VRARLRASDCASFSRGVPLCGGALAGYAYPSLVLWIPASSRAHALAAGTRSQASTTSQSHSRSPGAKSPARPSRNSTSTAPKEKSRATDVEGDPGKAANANEVADASNGDGSDARIARPALAHTPGSNSAIDPLSQVSPPQLLPSGRPLVPYVWSGLVANAMLSSKSFCGRAPNHRSPIV
jgi:hypothetical protein